MFRCGLNFHRTTHPGFRCAILAIAFFAVASYRSTSSGAENLQIAVVHASDFGTDEDKNGDGWPDDWKRIFDRQHPKYVHVGTDNREPIDYEELQQARRSLAQWVLAFQQGVRPGDVVPEKIPAEIDRIFEDRLMNRCLHIEMDGGAVLVESKPFEIDRRFTYRLSAELRCDQLDDFSVQLSMVGLTAERKEVPLGSSTSLSGTRNWTPIKLNNILIQNPELTSAKLRLEVKPINFQALHGKVSLDSVRVYRQPKLSVILDPTSHVITAGESLVAQCEITGLDRNDSNVQIQIRDVERRIVQRIMCDVETEASSNEGVAVESLREEQFVGTCHTRIDFPEPGFFELVVSLNDSAKQDFNQILPVVVLPSKDLIPVGSNPRFGLSIDQAGRSIPWLQAMRIVKDLGLGNIKIPVWFDASNGEEIDQLAAALDAFNSQAITPIAVLDVPPPSQRLKFPGDNGNTLIGSLDLPAIWQPMLDPILQRITLNVREFQLGWDSQTTILHDNKLPGILQNVRTKLSAYEPEVKLSIPCNVTSKEITSTTPIVNRFQLYSEPGLVSTEIENYGQALGEIASDRWLSIATLDERKYGNEPLILDVAEKMVALTSSNFPVGFFTRNSGKNVFDEQGRPGMLYLPIRNLASWLNRCERFETIQITPEQKAILLFKDNKTDLLLYPPESYSPTRIWLGQDLAAIDVWGRAVSLETNSQVAGSPVILPNNRWPILIKDVNESLIRWQSAVELLSKDLVMTTTSTVDLAVQITNPEPSTSIGSVKIIAPNLIREGAVDFRFNAPEGEKTNASAGILLRSDVAEGEVPIKIIVSVDSPNSLSFELDRAIHVGLPGVRIVSKTQMSKTGDLIIDVTLENQTPQTKSFDMLLFLPQRPRERTQLVNVKDTQVRRIIVPRANDLRGQTLRLSCEETGTGRTINHLVQVAP